MELKCTKEEFEMYERMCAQAQSFRHLDHFKHGEMIPFNLGWATRMIKEMPGRNDSCPCGSGSKFKKCCIELNESRI